VTGHSSSDSAGYNVVSDRSCTLTASSDKVATPNLGALGNYGGATWTMPIGVTSPAHDVRPSDCPTSTDQRGLPRPTTVAGATGCDAGAYQLQNQGYWLVAKDGGLFSYGTSQYHGSLPGTGLMVHNAVGMASNNHGGYWIAQATGAVHAYDATAEGTLPALHVVVNDITGIAGTPTGKGYWLVGADGGVFAFGKAAMYGSLPGLHVSVSDIVGITSTQTGNGYWLVGADGGVFSFGSAPVLGSLPGMGVSVHDIVSLAEATGGSGFWLVGSDGGVFAFGAGFYGSMGGTHLNGPVTGIASAPTGRGYWLVATDGGIFAFGSAAFLGSMGGQPLNQPEIGIAAAPLHG
jgi:hypothetical protein